MSETSIGIRPIKKGVIVDIYDNGEIPLMIGGKPLLMINDADLGSVHTGSDGKIKHKGIRPRWGLVLAVSDEATEQSGIRVGDKVLMEHASWTPAFTYNGNRKGWWINHEKIIGVDENGLTRVERQFIADRDRSRA